MKQKYFKLLGKSILFVVSFFVIDWLLGFGITKLRDKAFEKNEEAREFRNRYCIERATPDVAIIGSSTGSHHYIPKQMEDSLGMSVYNFANDGRFFLYHNVLINLMLDRYTPKVIIWEIGESCLSSEHGTRYEYQSMADMYPYYKRPYVKKVVDEKDCYQRLRMLSHCYQENSNLLMWVRLCFERANDRNKGYIPIEQSKFVNNAKEQDLKQFVIVNEKVDILRHTFDRCNKEGVQLIITSSPRFLDGSILETDYYDTLMKVANKYNIPYINYYNAQPFCNDSTLFKDNSHMNHIGTELYMSKFIPKLKEVLGNNNK